MVQPNGPLLQYMAVTESVKALKGPAPPRLQSLIEPHKARLALKECNTGMLTEPSLKTAGQRSTRPGRLDLLAP